MKKTRRSRNDARFDYSLMADATRYQLEKIGIEVLCERASHGDTAAMRDLCGKYAESVAQHESPHPTAAKFVVLWLKEIANGGDPFTNTTGKRGRRPLTAHEKQMRRMNLALEYWTLMANEGQLESVSSEKAKEIISDKFVTNVSEINRSISEFPVKIESLKK